MIRVILLGHSGFWMERTSDSAPPTYHVPYFGPDRTFTGPDQSEGWPSYGIMVFDCIARSGNGMVAIYMQRPEAQRLGQTTEEKT